MGVRQPSGGQEKGGLLPLSLTHEKLSGLVGASRPRVWLALRQLEERGFFVRQGKQIMVQHVALAPICAANV
jgi:Crp-like helix-turn-helix domain